jgi:phenylalanine-4-hydroxylase
MDKGLETAYHAPSAEGWTRGNLDFFTVPEKIYTAEENDVWRTLFKRQMQVLPKRAISQFMDSLSTLGIEQTRVPRFDEVNEILMKRTGWQVVPVPGFMPEEAFFELLANRRFPAGNFIRGREQLDYIQEPDVFHDLFGHVPILVDPIFADYMEAFGKGGLRAAELGTLEKVGRLYWYTVEFGLIQESQGLHIYGAGILSSATESVFCLEDPSPHRLKFDLKRIMQTHFRIDDFQDNYFVIDSFKQLFDETYVDFKPLYDELATQPVLEPGIIVPGDVVIHKGTGTYAVEANKRRIARRKSA